MIYVIKYILQIINRFYISIYQQKEIVQNEFRVIRQTSNA
jgi:hypothetical protein